MGSRLAIVAMASIVGLGACTDAGGTPATAPPITAAATTTTSTMPATTTTTVAATTTTISRFAEIEAIFQDLEVRRLQAIMDEDEEAFRAVFANDEYEDRSVDGMALVSVINPSQASFAVLEIFRDDHECIAVRGQRDSTGAVVNGNLSDPSEYVLEPIAQGWGWSWAGEGWRCDGPHPFSD